MAHLPREHARKGETDGSHDCSELLRRSGGVKRLALRLRGVQVAWKCRSRSPRRVDMQCRTRSRC